MQTFLGPDFLLDTAAARHLYHDVAAGLPIVDYHNHLIPEQIANDKKWDTIGEAWLAGDHYKWRAMRWAGIPEEKCSGAASFREKFDAFASVVPKCFGNPLYHWTHLELQRYFGINELLSPETADMIWEKANGMLAEDSHSARGLLRQLKVEFVGTTDAPCDDLAFHKQIAEDASLSDMVVAPSFRPDVAYKIDLPGFDGFIADLAKIVGYSVDSYAPLMKALIERLDHFVAHGCKATDHGIDVLRFAKPVDEASLDAIIAKRLSGEALSELEIAQFQTNMFVDLSKAYYERDLVMQLHIGAVRNSNHRLFKSLGPDVGGDSINDRPIAIELNGLMGEMDRDGHLPKTVLYHLNPSFNEVIVSTAGNFQDGEIAGKVQAGSGWWFNDQLNGMERQMTQLSQMGLFSHFIGMLTDSRSFLSFPRHEYFRRLVCQMVGRWVENGHVPDDTEMLDKLVRDVCYQNAANWFLPQK
ncbi:glucuronate isomerase [uncultured Cohaesibacter sp.]|uniref:glucuronate isomerase n=1 Tax=uncultured Cohaesibacter sp. TaxID=1002546 RepID=UPI002AA95420|nr:glucuronate isomerase [uncultured Cohaesibacter sp.]